MPDLSSADEPVRLFWTGGWDSTFRLLSLVILQKRRVQPYYMVNAMRHSMPWEIDAMSRIRKQVAADHPQVKGLILPVFLRDVDDIPPDEEITKSYERLCSVEHVGVQYERCSRFAKAEGLTHLELGLIKGAHMDEVIGTYLVRRTEGAETVREVDPKHQGTDVYRVFKDFRFPLLEVTKKDMQVVAREHGFENILLLTRFCAAPLRDGRPCGACIPCGIVMRSGFGWRLPRRSRVRYRVRQGFLKIRSRFEKHPRFLSMVDGALAAIKRLVRRQGP